MKRVVVDVDDLHENYGKYVESKKNSEGLRSVDPTDVGEEVVSGRGERGIDGRLIGY